MGYLPEVVRIIAAHVGGAGGGGKAIGTGFFLTPDGKNILEEGLLMTNAHVVTNSPVVKIMTTYVEHQALPVTVVSVCHDRDLALLKVEPQVQQFSLYALQPLQFSSSTRAGTCVVYLDLFRAYCSDYCTT